MNCPHCHCAMADRPDLAGMTFACPQCGGPFTVPGPLAQMPFAAPQVATRSALDLSTHQVRSPHTTVHVNVPQQRSNSLGIASLVLGVLALLFCWLPIFGPPMAALGLLLGAIGFFVALGRGGSGLGFSIAGSFLSLLVLGIYAVFIAGAVGAVKIADEAVKEAERQRAIDDAARRAATQMPTVRTPSSQAATARTFSEKPKSETKALPSSQAPAQEPMLVKSVASTDPLAPEPTPSTPKLRAWQEPRRWTVAGVAVEGSLKSWSGSKAILKLSDGTERTISPDELSATDRRWVEERLGK